MLKGHNQTAIGKAASLGAARRFLPAVLASVVLHAATIPLAVDYIQSHLADSRPALPPVTAQLEPEPPQQPVEMLRQVVEPPPEPPPAQEEVRVLPAEPQLVLPDLSPPRLEASPEIRIPESAWGEIFVPASTRTHRGGSLNVPVQPEVEPEAEPSDVADTEPVAPIFPDHPPREFLDDLPSHAVRLGRLTTVFGSKAESELRQRVYAQTYYPEAAADLELEGVVIVGFRVDGEGRPTSLKVTNPKECHPILQEEALAMVRNGAPYPVPEARRNLSLTVAAAYLNTPDHRAERVSLLLPSGIEVIDQHVRQMAAQDALSDSAQGWRLALYKADAEVTIRPGCSVVSPRLDSYRGDPRLKRLVLENLQHLLPSQEGSAFLKIPIQFRILDH